MLWCNYTGTLGGFYYKLSGLDLEWLGIVRCCSCFTAFKSALLSFCMLHGHGRVLDLIVVGQLIV